MAGRRVEEVEWCGGRGGDGDDGGRWLLDLE